MRAPTSAESDPLKCTANCPSVCLSAAVLSVYPKPTAVMTKVDLLDSSVRADPLQLYKAAGLQRKIDLCQANLGVPGKRIFPVRTYDNLVNRDKVIEEPCLMALAAAAQEAEAHRVKYG